MLVGCCHNCHHKSLQNIPQNYQSSHEPFIHQTKQIYSFVQEISDLPAIKMYVQRKKFIDEYIASINIAISQYKNSELQEFEKILITSNFENNSISKEQVVKIWKNIKKIPSENFSQLGLTCSDIAQIKQIIDINKEKFTNQYILNVKDEKNYDNIEQEILKSVKNNSKKYKEKIYRYFENIESQSEIHSKMWNIVKQAKLGGTKSKKAKVNKSISQNEKNMSKYQRKYRAEKDENFSQFFKEDLDLNLDFDKAKTKRRRKDKSFVQKSEARLNKVQRQFVKQGIKKLEEKLDQNQEQDEDSDNSSYQKLRKNLKIQKLYSHLARRQKEQIQVQCRKIENINPGDENLTLYAKVIEIGEKNTSSGLKMCMIGDETAICKALLPEYSQKLKYGDYVYIQNYNADVIDEHIVLNIHPESINPKSISLINSKTMLVNFTKNISKPAWVC